MTFLPELASSFPFPGVLRISWAHLLFDIIAAVSLVPLGVAAYILHRELTAPHRNLPGLSSVLPN